MKVVTLLRLFEASRELAILLPSGAASKGKSEEELDTKFEKDLRSLADDSERRREFRSWLWKQRRSLQLLVDENISLGGSVLQDDNLLRPS